MSSLALTLSLLFATQGINTADGIAMDPIVSISSRTHLWRMTDTKNNVVCYLMLPAMFEEAPPALQCVSIAHLNAPVAENMLNGLFHQID